MDYTSAVRKCIHIESITKFNLIHEKEWIGGDTVSNICKRYVYPGRHTTNGIIDRYKQKDIENMESTTFQLMVGRGIHITYIPQLKKLH